MPRKGSVPRREVPSDPVFSTPLVSKFVNCMMWDGRKSTAEQIFYSALKIMEQKIGLTANARKYFQMLLRIHVDKDVPVKTEYVTHHLNL